MRVLHILDHALPTQDGYVYRTLGLLQGQRALGFETYHLTSPRQTGQPAPTAGANALRFAPTPAVGAGWPAGLGELAEMRATARRLDALCRRLRPDLLHAHSPLLNGYPALWVGRRRQLPVVYEIRAFWEDAAVEQRKQTAWGARYRATRALETALCRRADGVVTICEGLRRDLIARGIAPDKLTVVPNTVDLPAALPDPAAIASTRQRLGLDGCLVLGFIGSFYDYEGLALLIGALPRLLAEHGRLRLLLVGGGEQEAALRAQVAALGLARQVIFAGQVPHGQVAALYGAINLCLYPRLPCRLTELVTPLKPLEAMAHGRLVLAADLGGHRELITPGETGLLFTAGQVDALIECVDGALKAPERWPALQAAGRQFVAARPWPTVAAAYRTLFEAVARRGTARAQPDADAAASHLGAVLADPADLSSPRP